MSFYRRRLLSKQSVLSNAHMYLGGGELLLSPIEGQETQTPPPTMFF